MFNTFDSCISLNGPFIRSDSKGIIATARVVSVRPPDQNGAVATEIEITEPFLNATVGSRVTVYTVWGEAACGYPHFRESEDYLIFTAYISKKKDSLWPNIQHPTIW